MSSFSSPNLVFEQTYDDIFLNCPVPKTAGIKRWAKIHTKKMHSVQAVTQKLKIIALYFPFSHYHLNKNWL